MKFGVKLAACAAAVAVSLGMAQAAQAQSVDWTISNGTFDDGGTFSGTFTFDSATDAITSWNVTTAAGPFGGYSSPGGCFIFFCSSAFDNGSGPTFQSVVFIFGSSFELTDIPMGTPGTVAVLTGDETFSSPFGNSGHTVTGGQAVGVAAVPEPAGWALMIGGFGLAGAALRLRKRATA